MLIHPANTCAKEKMLVENAFRENSNEGKKKQIHENCLQITNYFMSTRHKHFISRMLAKNWGFYPNVKLFRFCG